MDVIFVDIRTQIALQQNVRDAAFSHEFNEAWSGSSRFEGRGKRVCRGKYLFLALRTFVLFAR
jgi:hypothetical protein